MKPRITITTCRNLWIFTSHLITYSSSFQFLPFGISFSQQTYAHISILTCMFTCVCVYVCIILVELRVIPTLVIVRCHGSSFSCMHPQLADLIVVVVVVVEFIFLLAWHLLLPSGDFWCDKQAKVLADNDQSPCDASWWWCPQATKWAQWRHTRMVPLFVKVCSNFDEIAQQ